MCCTKQKLHCKCCHLAVCLRPADNRYPDALSKAIQAVKTGDQKTLNRNLCWFVKNHMHWNLVVAYLDQQEKCRNYFSHTYEDGKCLLQHHTSFMGSNALSPHTSRDTESNLFLWIWTADTARCGWISLGWIWCTFCIYMVQGHKNMHFGVPLFFMILIAQMSACFTGSWDWACWGKIELLL